MKQGTLALLGLATLLSTASCAKKVVAAKPANTTPVASAAPSASTPESPRSSGGPAAAPSQRTAETPRQAAVMTPEDRFRLNETLARMEDALFDYDKSTIRDDARTALRDDVKVIGEILAHYPNQKLLIEGHCDERGSDEYNLALGDRRAKASVEFLGSMGISTAQLTVISFGKDRPVCTDKTEDCWQKNRRAHLTAAP